MRARFGLGTWCVLAAILLVGVTLALSSPVGAQAAGRARPGSPAGSRITVPVPRADIEPLPHVARQFTVIAGGDILLHPGLWSQARRDAAARGRSGYDFDPVFTSAVPDISGADLAICHLETPLGKANGPFTGFPTFAVPPGIARTIHNVGYDTCSTASNHSLDGGEAGVERTLAALDAARVQHTGTARSAAEAARVDMLRVNDVNVAQLSYSYGFNGAIRPAGKPWLANLINVPAILADAHRAKQAGAEVVIVSLHFGSEYTQAPSAQQLSVARALLASPDIDLLIGCHVHVVQPFQKISGKWVVYGMGNQIAEQGFSNRTRDGVMPRFTFTETSFGKFTVTRAEAIPTFDRLRQDGGPIRLIDLPRALADPHLSAARRAQYEASWQRTAHAVNAMGAAHNGLVVVGKEVG